MMFMKDVISLRVRKENRVNSQAEIIYRKKSYAVTSFLHFCPLQA